MGATFNEEKLFNANSFLVGAGLPFSLADSTDQFYAAINVIIANDTIALDTTVWDGNDIQIVFSFDIPTDISSAL